MKRKDKPPSTAQIVKRISQLSNTATAAAKAMERFAELYRQSPDVREAMECLRLSGTLPYTAWS